MTQEENNFKNKIYGSLILFSAGLIWGLHHVVVRNALDNVSTQQLQLYQYLIAAIVMSVVCFKSIKKLTKSEIIHGSVIGLLVYVGQMFQINATAQTTIGKVSFITTLYVVMVPILAAVLYKKKIHITTILAIVLSMSGLYLLTQASGGINIGDILAFLSSVCFSIEMIVIDQFVKTDSPINLTYMQVVSSLVYAIIAILITGDPVILTGLSGEGWFCILYIALISSALGFFLQIFGQKKVPPQVCSIILTTEAPAATIFAAIFLGEAITLKSGIGCALMLVAMIIAQF